MTDAQRPPAAIGRTATEWAAWIAALLSVAMLLAAIGFESRDPDSALHASIVRQSYQRPVAEWIAPSWGGNWTRTDLYREHPAGIFLLPSALARMGYPAPQSAYVVNAVFQILTVLALTSFGRLFLPAAEARMLGWLLLFLPIAFTYRVRANHEQAVLLLTIVALYIAERARASVGWAPFLVLPAVLTFLVKGVFVVPVLAGCAIWLVLRRPLPGRGKAAWMALALAAVAAVLTAAAYEWGYRRVTGGETFLGYYLSTQLGIAAAPRGTFIAQKLANIGWYAGRLLWFAFPWSLWLLVNVGRQMRRSESRREAFFAITVVALMWPFMFSLSDRHADRYIFPAYFLVGMAGAAIGLERSTVLRRVSTAADRLRPFEQAGAWLLLTLLALAARYLNAPRVQL